jgi:hypothetical protein
MKTKLIKISMTAAGLAAVTTILLAADPSPAPNQSAQITELTRKISRLEERMAKMEEKMNQPPKVVPLQHSPGPKLLDRDQPPPPGKIWGEGEVNGWKFYVIPLNGSDGLK